MTKAIEAAARAIAKNLGMTCHGGERIRATADLWVAEMDIGTVDVTETAQAAITAFLAAMEADIVEAVAQTLMCDHEEGEGPCEIGYKVAARLRAMIAAATPHDDGGE